MSPDMQKKKKEQRVCALYVCVVLGGEFQFSVEQDD